MLDHQLSTKTDMDFSNVVIICFENGVFNLRHHYSKCPGQIETVTVLQHVRPSVRPEKFPGICWRTHGGNDLKFFMLMYLDHPQNWLDYGCGLWIFLLLVLLWLSETGQIWGCWAFPGDCMEGICWNFACWCILATFRTDELSWGKIFIWKKK